MIPVGDIDTGYVTRDGEDHIVWREETIVLTPTSDAIRERRAVEAYERLTARLGPVIGSLVFAALSGRGRSRMSR